jgi:hypothetical protein
LLEEGLAHWLWTTHISILCSVTFPCQVGWQDTGYIDFVDGDDAGSNFTWDNFNKWAIWIHFKHQRTFPAGPLTRRLGSQTEGEIFDLDPTTSLQLLASFLWVGASRDTHHTPSITPPAGWATQGRVRVRMPIVKFGPLCPATSPLEVAPLTYYNQYKADGVRLWSLQVLSGETLKWFSCFVDFHHVSRLAIALLDKPITYHLSEKSARQVLSLNFVRWGKQPAGGGWASKRVLGLAWPKGGFIIVSYMVLHRPLENV